MVKNEYGNGYQKKAIASGDQKSGNKGDPILGGKIKASHILVDRFNKAQEISEDLKVG